jgi:hypothetical protein
MNALFLALATSFTLLAALVAGRDAAGRGAPWGRVAVAVGGVTLLGCVAAVAGADSLVAGYRSLQGAPRVATTPQMAATLVAAVAAFVTGVVLSGYGALSWSGPDA